MTCVMFRFCKPSAELPVAQYIHSKQVGMQSKSRHLLHLHTTVIICGHAELENFSLTVQLPNEADNMHGHKADGLAAWQHLAASHLGIQL